MILRELTRTDLRSLGPWAKLQLEAWGHIHVSASRLEFERLADAGFRFFELAEAGTRSALIISSDVRTDKGPGANIALFMAAHDHPDSERALDAVALYASQIALSEGVKVVSSRIMAPEPWRSDLVAYATKRLGMTLVDDEHVAGTTSGIIKNILNRRPEWLPSL